MAYPSLIEPVTAELATAHCILPQQKIKLMDEIPRRQAKFLFKFICEKAWHRTILPYIFGGYHIYSTHHLKFVLFRIALTLGIIILQEPAPDCRAACCAPPKAKASGTCHASWSTRERENERDIRRQVGRRSELSPNFQVHIRGICSGLSSIRGKAIELEPRLPPRRIHALACDYVVFAHLRRS